MSLQILEVNPETMDDDEFVKILVLENCNLNQFAVTDETFDKEGKESDIFRHTYFFPTKKVFKDEIIYLFTSIGDYKKGKEGNQTTHNYYWGSDISIWNNKGDEATIIKYIKIDSLKYNKKSTVTNEDLLLKNIIKGMK